MGRNALAFVWTILLFGTDVHRTGVDRLSLTLFLLKSPFMKHLLTPVLVIMIIFYWLPHSRHVVLNFISTLSFISKSRVVV